MVAVTAGGVKTASEEFDGTLVANHISALLIPTGTGTGPLLSHGFVSRIGSTPFRATKCCEGKAAGADEGGEPNVGENGSSLLDNSERPCATC